MQPAVQFFVLWPTTALPSSSVFQPQSSVEGLPGLIAHQVPCRDLRRKPPLLTEKDPNGKRRLAGRVETGKTMEALLRTSGRHKASVASPGDSPGDAVSIAAGLDSSGCPPPKSGERTWLIVGFANRRLG